jgi:Ca2+-binding EF-hand superfamily protein
MEDSGRVDDDEDFFGITDSRKEALSLLAVRKAAAVAIGSTTSMIDGLQVYDIQRHTRLMRQHIELESCLLAAEHAFFDLIVVEMDHSEKLRTLCELIDKDGDGVDVNEIFDALCKINHAKNLEEILPLAEDALDEIVFANRLLNASEFDHFLRTLAKCAKCTFNDIVQLLVSQVVFSEDGRSILEDFVDTLDTEDDDSFNRSILSARMLIVFDMMDYQHEGSICFKEVVKHLSRFTADSINSEQRKVLLMVDPEKARTMTFREFAELILNIVAASPTQLQFHEIANAMTLSICRQDVTDDDIFELFWNQELYEDALAHHNEDEHELHDLVSFGKLNRLFDLLDLTKDGFLDAVKVALFLRKYQSKQVDLDETMQETIESILAIDQNQDKKLDRKDFTILVSRLAHATGLQVHRFIDFVVVQTALKDDNARERAYFESYIGLDTHAQRGSLRSSVKSLMQKARIMRRAKSSED